MKPRRWYARGIATGRWPNGTRNTTVANGNGATRRAAMNAALADARRRIGDPNAGFGGYRRVV